MGLISGEARSGRAPGALDVLPKKVQCCDESVNHWLPIAVVVLVILHLSSHNVHNTWLDKIFFFL